MTDGRDSDDRGFDDRGFDDRDSLRISVADLLTRAGRRRHEQRSAVFGDLAVLDTVVGDDEPVRLDVQLDSVNNGIVAVGTVEAAWQSECRRCLRPVAGDVTTEIMEVFEAEPTEGDTLPLEGVEIDLAPVAREAVLLSLPLTPLCAEDCAGLCPTCGVDRNTGACDCTEVATDPRWAALDALRFDA